jgi:hypothetical protein
MSKMKLLARLGAAVILATGVFAGIPGPANATAEGGHRHTVVTGTASTGQSTGTGSGKVQLFDTGWG